MSKPRDSHTRAIDNEPVACRVVPRRRFNPTIALVASTSILFFAAGAHAQAPNPAGEPPHTAPAGAPAAPTPAASAQPGAADQPTQSATPEATPDVATLAAELAAQKKQLDEQHKQLEDQKKQIDDQQKQIDETAANASAPVEDSADDKFKIYGFTDVGVQRLWIDPTSPVANFLNSANATSFVVGNLDFYFDAKPVKDWRALVETRFTNAPQGQVTGLGGLGGGFKRTSTQQIDPNSGSLAAPMWAGSIVIERAHIDWTHFDLMKVRTGSFLTPFGIWNVDHGTPTLISVQEPLLLQYQGIPVRQTGVMAYGSTFAGDWELGYNFYVTNGRQELSNFAFNDDRGFGARLYANDDRGDLVLKFGASGYTGRTQDLEIDATAISPLVITSKSTWAYREWVGGLDASIDVGRTRIRSEVAVRKVDYDAGKHPAADPLYSPGAFSANAIWTSAYVLVAHQLPFLGLEPYAMFDSLHGPLGVGDTALAPSGGFNIRFNPSVMLKTQVSRTMFYNTRNQAGDYPAGTQFSKNNLTYAVSRLVLVF